MIKTAIISGAGIGGLTAAIALARKGVKVRVFEQSPVLGEVGAGLQLSPNAMRVLNSLGLGDALQSVSFSPEKAVIKNGLTGRDLVSLPLKSSKNASSEPPYFHVHRADLHEVLRQAACDLGATIQLSTPIDGYDAGGFRGVEKADLCIAADGVRSQCALQMHPDIPPRFTGQIAWRGTFATTDLEPNLIPPNATAWVGPNRHIVTYYIRAGAIVNFVAVEEKHAWKNSDWSTVGDINELRSAYSGWHSTIGKVLASAEAANVWALFDKPPLPNWFEGRTVLLGDACHPTLPFLAQGAAMAIEDAFVLAECLDRADSIPHALGQYEALRKPRTTMLQAKARANAALFHLTGPLGGALPRLKLAVAQRLPTKLQALPFQKIYSYDATKQVR